MPLTLEFGYATETGPRERNEDLRRFRRRRMPQLAATKGMLAVVADGVSGGTHGREAAESTVRNLLADYYATPDTWEIPHALGTVLRRINRWLQRPDRLAPRSRRHGDHAHRAGAARPPLSLLAHVGDSRMYRLRGETLDAADHRPRLGNAGHVACAEARAGTRHPCAGRISAKASWRRATCFLIVCDGVWEPLGQLELHRLLKLHDEPAACRRMPWSRRRTRAAGRTTPAPWWCASSPWARPTPR